MHTDIVQEIDPLAEVPSEQTGKVIGILEAYLAKLEQGSVPHPEALLAQYPEHAEVLRSYLEKLDLLNQAAGMLRGSASTQEAIHTSAGSSNGRLGDYAIVREVGRGGMGLVYEAFQLSLSRRVALKVLPSAAALDPRQLQRFKNEAQAAAQLHHPNIVPIFGVGSEGGVHYYAMQFIDGRTLAALIQDLRQQARTNAADPTESVEAAWEPGRPLPGGIAKRVKSVELPGGVTEICPDGPVSPPSASTEVFRHTPLLAGGLSTTLPAYFHMAAQMGAQVAEALEHAHQLGVIHRDIKPANLLVDGQGKVWVTDFGLAQFRTSVELTRSGDLVGTLRYMSPEQALSRRALVDQRTDIYSLGASLYELITLKPVFDGRDREELLGQIAFEEPRPPRRLNRAIPSGLETIVLKAMTKDPAGRYATAQEFADDLRRFLGDEPIHARRPTVLQRTAKFYRRHRAVLLTTLIVALLGLGTSIAASFYQFWQGKVQAEAEREFARRGVDDMYLIMQKWLAHEPQVERVQRESLLTILHFYEEFAREQRTVPDARYKAAQAAHRVGDIHLAMAQWPPAESAQHLRASLEATNQAIAMLERLAHEFPGNFAYQKELADSHMTLGVVLQDMQRGREAERAFVHSRDRLDKLASDVPDKAEYWEKLAVCHHKLGSILSSVRQRSKEAEEAYRKAQGLLEKLAADSPEEFSYANRLAAVCVSYGKLLGSSGRPSQAEALFHQGIDVYDRLLKEDPRSPLDLRHELGEAYYQLGAAIVDSGSAMNDSVAIQTAALSSLPHGRLPLGSYALGIAVTRIARLYQAERAYEQGLRLYEKLVEASPQIPRYQGYLGLTLDAVAQLWRQRGDLKRAREYGERAVRHQRTALTASPESWTYGLALQKHYRHLGEVLLLLGDYEQAARAAHELANVISRCPIGGSTAMDFLARSAMQAQEDARLSRTDKRSRIKKYLDEATILARQAAEVSDGLPQVQNNVAWFLVACLDPHYRDPTLAVKLARRAVDKEPQIFCYWNTLGLAHYRNGEYQNAIKALKKSIQLNPGGESLDWFILAMAQWQAGEKEQAQRSFDQAVRQQSGASDEELSRFRAEAASLLERPNDAKPRESVAGPKMIPANAAECIDCPRKARDPGWTRGSGLDTLDSHG